jgi:thioredoxin 1
MYELTPENDITEIMKQDCYLFFYFTASWCGPCKQISPYIEELSNKYTHIQFYKIDIDTNEELSSTWNIKGVPTFYLLHKTNLIAQTSGANKELILQLVEQCK